MKTVFVFGNGNLSFEDFHRYYVLPIESLLQELNVSFILCDFRGTDVLVMEFLKTQTPNVSIYHIGERPRYVPDSFKTEVKKWIFRGGFSSDIERDSQAIYDCTHFLGVDFNSDSKRQSGTSKNIERCLSLGKIKI